MSLARSASGNWRSQAPWDEVLLIAPDTVFDEETTVDLGSMTLELHHLPGHTPDTIVGFVPERGLLLMGDTAETPFPVVPADSPLARLDRWPGALGAAIRGSEPWCRRTDRSAASTSFRRTSTTCGRCWKAGRCR